MAISKQFSPYCIGWNRLRSAQKAVARSRNYDQIDAAERAVHRFVKSIMEDPRKLADMKQACPAEAAEIERLAQNFATPKMISDPAHDSDSMKRWVGTLAAEQIADLEKAIKEQKGATKKKARTS